MSRQPYSSGTADNPKEALFYLASELETADDGVRVRKKREQLAAAGIQLAGGCEEAPRSEGDICSPSHSYPQGVSPADGSLHWGA